MPKVKDFILEQIVPGFHAKRSNKIVSGFYKNRLEFDVEVPKLSDDERKIYIEQVESDLKAQHDRKKIIEDKAKSLLFIIAVSITAITFSLTYLNSIKFNVIQAIALSFLMFSILYLIQGVIKALQTLNIRQFHVIQAEVEITESTYKLSERKSGVELLKELVRSKQQNDLINIRLSNYTYASYNLIRNGIILFGMFFLTTIAGNYCYKKAASQDTFIMRKEIKTTVNDTVNVVIPYSFELKYDLKNLEVDKKINSK